MSNNKCARAVMLAAIAATGLGTAAGPIANSALSLAESVAASSPLSHLHSTKTLKLATVNVDQGNMHVHINAKPNTGESSFEV